MSGGTPAELAGLSPRRLSEHFQAVRAKQCGRGGYCRRCGGFYMCDSARGKYCSRSCRDREKRDRAKARKAESRAEDAA